MVCENNFIGHFPDAKVAKWKKRLKGVCDIIAHLHCVQKEYPKIISIINKNTRLFNYNLIESMYVYYVGMKIRQIVDKDRDAISLKALLIDISGNLDGIFGNLKAKQKCNIDLEVLGQIKEDINYFENEKIVNLQKYIDNFIAHKSAKNDTTKKLIFDEVKEIILNITEIYQRYERLLENNRTDFSTI